MKIPAYLTRKELALRWNCSLTTIRRKEQRGELPAVRLSIRIVRFELSAIEQIEREASCAL